MEKLGWKNNALALNWESGDLSVNPGLCDRGEAVKLAEPPFPYSYNMRAMV